MQSMLLLFFTSDVLFSLSFELYQAKPATQASAFPLIRSPLTCIMYFELNPQVL